LPSVCSFKAFELVTLATVNVIIFSLRRRSHDHITGKPKRTGKKSFNNKEYKIFKNTCIFVNMHAYTHNIQQFSCVPQIIN
jgi:hypothetical protein